MTIICTWEGSSFHSAILAVLTFCVHDILLWCLQKPTVYPKVILYTGWAKTIFSLYHIISTVRARFSWWEASSPASSVTFVWKVGGPSSRHHRRQGSRCRKHREEWGMGSGHPSQSTKGSEQWSNYIIIYEGAIVSPENFLAPHWGPSRSHIWEAKSSCTATSVHSNTCKLQ